MEFNRVPQCAECLPELRADNRDAVKIWLITEGQLIMGGMGGVIGVNQLAVWQAIDRYRVRKPVQTFEKVLRLHQEITMEQMSEGDNGD